MELPADPTLLQTAMVIAPLEDVERAWAFCLFCGILESTAHDEFVRLAGEKSSDPVGLADTLLDSATPRAELVDVDQALALRLWEYFKVGQSLEPEPDEGTNPGLSTPVEPS